MKLVSFARKMDRPSMKRGWGNGYVGVPPGHPFNGLFYNDLPDGVHDVHGGVTFSESVEEFNGVLKKHFPLMNLTGWWFFGFDTAHAGDNERNRSYSFVVREIERFEKLIEENS
jgi:hypothetical protein